MSFNNAPILTGAEMLEHVGTLAGSAESTDAALIRAVKNVLVAFGDKLKNKFYVMLPVAPMSSAVDLSELGIGAISNVWWSCGNSGPWQWTQGFSLRDHILSIYFEDVGGCHGAWIKLEHWQNPMLMASDAVGTVTQTFQYATSGGGELKVNVADMSWVPPAGYVKVGDGADAQWFEYQAVYLKDDPSTDVHLMLSTKQPWAHQTGTVFPGEAVVWGIGFPNTLALDAVATQAAAYYWAARTGSCTNEDDRSVATQLMNFWSGEAENKWKRTTGERTARVVRTPVLLRGAEPWQFP